MDFGHFFTTLHDTLESFAQTTIILLDDIAALDQDLAALVGGREASGPLPPPCYRCVFGLECSCAPGNVSGGGGCPFFVAVETGGGVRLG
jgi:hypothetical protein